MASRTRNLAATAVLAVGVPLAFLGLVEGALWLAGVAPLAGDARYVAAARHRSCQFAFRDAERRCRLPEPSSQLPGRLVVVLGGSSVVGYQAPGAAFPGVLQRLLDAAHPGEYRVVNLGRLCKDSIYVRDCAARVLTARPDVLVVYAGHNDYANWGLRQPARKIFLEENAWIYEIEEAASRTRLFSMLAGLVGDRRAGLAAAPPPIADEDLERAEQIVLDEFTGNVTGIAALARQHGAALLVVTVVSNLHEYPYASGDWDRVPIPHASAGARQRRWHEAFSRGIEAFRAGRHAAALEAFAGARDLSTDGRAHGRLNERIRALGRGPHRVRVVDFERRLHALGAAEGIGCNFFGGEGWCDQFHPNARTHALIARAVFEEIEALRRAAPVASSDARRAAPAGP
jgi:lysophospholipase L1-like esterase